jgi:hypothetical protein
MFLISSVRNISYDLRLLHILKIKYINNIRLYNNDLADTIEKTRYGVGVSLSYQNNGTIENVIQGYPNDINHVEDAEWMLIDVIQLPLVTTRNNILYSSLNEKIGDLHIRFTSDMEFIPNP